MTDNRIAVIGRAGRFPAARNVAEFWKLLAEGRVAAHRLSDAELLAEGVSRKALADPNYVRLANILPDMECFDAGFFGFSPREAAILDPQHRHFLECAWEALEDAGRMPDRFDGRIGVYAGSGMQAYLPFNLLSNPDLVAEIGLFLLRHTGNDKDFLTTRLSYLLNLTGPSVAVQTACSTSLVAVHMAVNSLLDMECDMALAGGVTIELPHRVGYLYAEGEILSPDGLCRAFDDNSQGTVFGSGAALVVLRRYQDALADGDDIKAVILASAINNDGAGKASYLAPSVDGQAEAAAEAVALAGIAPGAVSYIETHGTGTPIGDPIELAALQQVYGAAAPGSIGIGSVKTNIGHLDTAAGGASLIKVIEAMRHRQLPASLNFKTPNSRFDFAASPFRVVAARRDWLSPDGPRRAAVNSLGVGGTNAHVIVEEAPQRAPATASDAWQILTFSARTPAALTAIPDKWRDFLAGDFPADPAPAMADIAFTLREGRRGFAERLAIAARTPAELAAALQDRKSSHSVRGRAGDTAGDTGPEIVFLFPGGGAQYPGAGAEMLAQSPVFAQAVQACFAALPPDAPADLYDTMFVATLADDAARARMGQSGYAIPALFILEYAYARLWESWGIRPIAILAHSVGEYAGAVVAGALSLGDALRITSLRGQVMDAAPKGAMTAVPADEATVRALIGDQMDIAALNGAQTTVVSGTVKDIAALETRLCGTEHEARRIHIDVAAHSRLLDGQLDRFRAGFAGVSFGVARIPMVSSLRGDWGRDGDFVTADYWVRHLRHTVRFTDAMTAALAVPPAGQPGKPGRIVIEVGPGQTLGPLVAAGMGEARPLAVLASAPKPNDPADEMGVALTALGGLWAHGAAEAQATAPAAGPATGPAGTPVAGGRRVSLPTYAFEKQRHWISPGTFARADPEPPQPLARLADIGDWFETLTWEPLPQAASTPLSGSWLVLAGQDAVSRAVLARLDRAGVPLTVVRPGAAFAAVPGGFELRPDSAPDFEALSAALSAALSQMPQRTLMLWALDPDLAAQAFDAAFLLTRMLQMADAGTGVTLGLAARGSASVAGEPVASPDGALLLGLARVAPREIPGLGALLVDIGVDEAPETAAQSLLEAVASPQADHLALRGSKDYIAARQRRHVAAPDGLPARLRQGGSYVLTGGTGGIGRVLALWLAETARARLTLLSRAGREDADLRRRITAAGGEVLFVQADVADADQLAAALDRTRAAFGTIHGVIHAAGVLDDAPLSAKSLADAHRVMAPKVQGGRNLHQLLPEGTLDFFAVVSSSSVVLGPPGQADYVAANAWLEALASARSDGFSIAWGVWRDVGMAASAYGGAQGAANGGGAHPVLGPRQDAPDGTIRFTGALNPATDWVVAEHVLNGVALLPGTAYLEMGHAAAKAVLGVRAFEMGALSLAAPMAFVGGAARQVVVQLTPVRGGYDLQIKSAVAAGKALQDHASLQIRTVAAADTTLPESLRKAAKQSGKLRRSDRSGRLAQETVMSFGPRWHNVGELRLGDGIAEGDFALPKPFAADLAGHDLHPALMDMAATVGLNLLIGTTPAGQVHVPMSIDRIRVFGPLPDRLTSRASLLRQEPRGFAVFDVVLSDLQGKPVAILEHLAMRAVELASLKFDAAPATLTGQLLETGIRSAEAPELFARVFSCPARQIVASPVGLDAVRLAMTELHAPARRPEGRPDGRRAKTAGISDPVEARLAEIWGDILGVDTVRPQDDFFALGGHSLNAVRMFGRVRREYGVNLPLATLFEAPTVEALAGLVSARVGPVAAPGTSGTGPEVGAAPGATPAALFDTWSPLVTISKGAPDRPPLFCVHGAGGNVLNLRAMSGYLDPGQPFIGVRAMGSDGGPEVDATIEAMAGRYVTALRERQPQGPYFLAGYSGGGVIAFEMARMLTAMGAQIGHMFFFDTLAPHVAQKGLTLPQKLWAIRKWDIRFALGWYQRRKAWRGEGGTAERIAQALALGEPLPDELIGQRLTLAFMQAQTGYQAGTHDGPVTIFRAQQASALFMHAGPKLGWQDHLTGPVEVHVMDCTHFTMMSEPAISRIAGLINQTLAR